MYRLKTDSTLQPTLLLIASQTMTSLLLVAILVGLSVTPALAHLTDDRSSSSLPYTIVRPPRVDPPAIPHTDIIEPTYLYNDNVGSGNLPAQSAIAKEQADYQGVSGEPGVLQTKTDIGEGLTLHREGNICNDFNSDDYWNGTTWTDYFAGWGPFAADDGLYQAKNVTFDQERNVGPGEKYGPNQASMKIASNQPYDAGVMSPAIIVKPGDLVDVRVKYLIYNHDTEGRNYDYASMGIIPAIGQQATHTQGYVRGQWTAMSLTTRATGDRIVVMLQGHSPDNINSNIYFDDVEVYINSVPLADCRG